MHVLPPRFAIAVAVFSLTSVVVSAAEPASAKNVGEATKNLEAARSKLAAAVKRIEVDAPSNPELEAAHDAVEQLQEALTAGAALETTDLEYAKAVLAARKELRAHREYVEQRRANVAVFDLRRKIDAAVQVMNRRVAKDLAADQLDAARTDVAAVKQLVGQCRKFSKQDPKVGPYLDGVDSAAAKQEKAIGDRWFQLSADKQREALEQASKGLSTALSELAAGFSDAKFEATDKAVVALAKTVADGKPLEERDRNYRAEADKARATLAQAKTKTEEAVAAAGVARVKIELDAPFGELKESMKTLRAGKSTEEQLNEAKTAAFVVRKLVDKYDVQGARSPAIAQYLQSLKDVLNEAEVLLQTKALLRARAEVNAALRGLSKRVPSDDEFAEAKASVVVLEKSLETLTAKDVKLANAAAEAKQAVKDSRAEIEKRRYQVDLTLQRTKTDDARKAAAALIAQLNKEKPTDQQLAEAEKALKEANDVLQAGAPFVKKDADYKAFDLETKAKLADLADRIARRRIALNAGSARESLVELLAGTQAKIEAAKVASASDVDLAAATNGVEAVGHAIQERAALAKQDVALAAYSDRAKNELNRMMENLDVASRMRQVRRATGDALTAANNALKEAESSNEPRKRKALYETTTQTLKSCKEDGPRLLVENPKLVNIDVLVSGQAFKPREVVAQCIEKFDSMSDTIKLAIAQVRFEDGPKKAYETAKSLLDQGKRNEAKAQFDECFATGVIEQQRYPEYKERKNSVGGTNLTVHELIQKCDAERKALKASK